MKATIIVTGIVTFEGDICSKECVHLAHDYYDSCIIFRTLLSSSPEGPLRCQNCKIAVETSKE
jgi:hypothetical protein